MRSMGERRILVVEDEADIRELLAFTLEVLAPVEVAVDGIDALDRIAERGPPAVILLDLNLPRLSGPELLVRLRERGLGYVPVVTMTASTRPAPPGVCAHLVKPFPLERALDALVAAAFSGRGGTGPGVAHAAAQ